MLLVFCRITLNFEKMAFKSICEILVHIETFKNIDLACQGLYKLCISVYNDETQELIQANPCSVTKANSTRKSVASQNHNIIPPGPDGNNIESKSFIIKYCDEEIDLNDICHFRIELNVGRKPPTLKLTAKLMYCDITDLRNSLHDPSIVEIAEFKCVNEMTYEISSAFTALFEFLPITFEN